MATLALLVLDYDACRAGSASGEAPPGAPVRVYVDNRPSAEVVVGEPRAVDPVSTQQLAPGNYTLRLDQLGSEGPARSRGWRRRSRRVSQPPVAGEAQVDYVIVQPGNSLWRIARRLFGDGSGYVHIYDANQDPDPRSGPDLSRAGVRDPGGGRHRRLTEPRRHALGR